MSWRKAGIFNFFGRRRAAEGASDVDGGPQSARESPNITTSGSQRVTDDRKSNMGGHETVHQSISGGAGGSGGSREDRTLNYRIGEEQISEMTQFRIRCPTAFPAIFLRANPPQPDSNTRDVGPIMGWLDKLFRDPGESYGKFLACREEPAQQLLDLLQDLLDYDLDPMSESKRRLFKALQRLSRASGLHPRCFTLPDLSLGTHLAGGSFSDVYKGSLRGQSVAVKIMRVFDTTNIAAAVQNFGQEAVIWRQLSHPHLLPFFGLYYVEKRPCLVSPWMENGDIRTFLRNTPCDTARRLNFILDVALGLEYLFREQVVHGDLKTANILVTPSGRACIADFGFSSIVSSIQLTTSTVRERGGTIRYQAPELHRGGHNTSQSDVYAFACVAYELLTEKYPFEDLRSEGAVITAVLRGARPSLRADDGDSPSVTALVDLIQESWHDQPGMRPTAVQIVERLRSSEIGAAAIESTIDWDDTYTSRFRRSLQPQPSIPTVAEIEQLVLGSNLSPSLATDLIVSTE
ncbi:Protein kinase domain-containing protein [Mycena sanguinolenta]|uniref:Protein kinase domain-containing protein n=1 Tax=Mycena sanguinolenta TaxID=230812 RepID=A0A8H7DA69_9AGAR|nr:Protein kinase domain-containing protein [Mycena sanguinolenta]